MGAYRTQNMSTEWQHIALKIAVLECDIVVIAISIENVGVLVYYHRYNN